MTWFTRYPRPDIVVYNLSAEFASECKKKLLGSHNIKITKSTRKDPQYNSIIECIHLVMLNIYYTLLECRFLYGMMNNEFGISV